MMELVGYARKRGGQVGGRRQLKVAATGGRRELREALIRFLLHRPAAAVASAVAAAPSAPAAAEATAAAPCAGERASGEADGGDHHVFFLRASHHFLQAAARRVHREVDAVGEDEDDAPALLMEEGRDADVDRVPQRRWPGFLQLRAQDREELVVIGREVAGIDLDPVGE